MTRILWLPETLRSAGLKVALCDGWETRGSEPPGEMQGVLLHHTAGPLKGNMPSLGVIRDGRPDLKGPLAQIGLGRDGTHYIVASGCAHHAGKGTWGGIGQGNAQLIGIEAENTGLSNDPWPDVQMDAYRRGVAAILTKLGQPATRCAGHKEYALPKGRKIDPTFNLGEFRIRVAEIMGGAAPPPKLIPIVAPITGRVTLRRGSTHAMVRDLDRLLGLPDDAVFDGATEAKVRQYQRDHGIVSDGIVGPKTWEKLDAAPVMHTAI